DALSGAHTASISLAAAFHNGQPGTPAAQFYVDPLAGNDLNPGTQAQPWRTLAHAAAQSFQPDTTIWLLPGTYAESSGAVSNSVGTATGRIRFVSTTQWGARIVSSTTASAAFTINGDYTDVVNLDMTAANPAQGIRIGLLFNGSYDRAIGNRVHDLCNFNPGVNGGAGIDFANYSATGGTASG